jgi:hypothetical protein
MARIRSVHPGLFTDEAFVSLTPIARVLLIGIWTEADDMGAFEWKAIQLKMRILPVDNVDVSSIMAELDAVNVVSQYEVDGRKYGAIRNFGRFQRPKKPNSIHPMPSEWRRYACTERHGSEPDEDEGGSGSEPKVVKEAPVPKKSELKIVQASTSSPPVPPTEEKSPQMEDGGWRMEDEKEVSISLPSEARRSEDLDDAVSGWNCMARQNGLPVVQRLTDPRKRALKARLAECGGIEGWERALHLITESPFLLGTNGGWKADFDFLLQPSKFTKLMEGSYADRGAKQAQSKLGWINDVAREFYN